MAITPYFMVTNRKIEHDDLSEKRIDKLSYFTSKGGADLSKFANWTPRTRMAA